MAYRLLQECRQAFTRRDTPPLSNRRHPNSDIAPLSRLGEGLHEFREGSGGTRDRAGAGTGCSPAVDAPGWPACYRLHLARRRRLRPGRREPGPRRLGALSPTTPQTSSVTPLNCSPTCWPACRRSPIRTAWDAGTRCVSARRGPSRASCRLERRAKRNCVQAATVRFRVVGPSDPTKAAVAAAQTRGKAAQTVTSVLQEVSKPMMGERGWRVVLLRLAHAKPSLPTAKVPYGLPMCLP